MKESPLEFYNNFVGKLLKDFILSNPRTAKAIMSGMKMIDFSTKDVLDIGCGIGWSSYEFSKKANSVLGIDLSENLICTANGLFVRENLKFKQIDVTEVELKFDNSFDIITMLDVLEHIPQSERNRFTQSVNENLKPSGVVFLSCPSVYHQQWLREEKPEGLQPVDEDIDLNILVDFASELDQGDVVYFSYESIWQSNDYFHAIVQKGPVSFKLSDNTSILEKSNLRFKRVKEFNDIYSVFSKEEWRTLRKRGRAVNLDFIKKRIKNILPNKR